MNKSYNKLETKFVEGNKTIDVVFHKSKGFGFPFDLNLDHKTAKKISAAHNETFAFEQEIMEWMAKSEKNKRLFLKNPIQALKKSKIKIPKKTLIQLQKASNLLIKNLKR